MTSFNPQNHDSHRAPVAYSSTQVPARVSGAGVRLLLPAASAPAFDLHDECDWHEPFEPNWRRFGLMGACAFSFAVWALIAWWLVF